MCHIPLCLFIHKVGHFRLFFFRVADVLYEINTAISQILPC